MDISYHGNACFTIKSKTATIVIDPFSEANGLKGPKSLTGDLAMVTSDNEAHNKTDLVKGLAYTVDWPGEYDIKDIIVEGVDLKGSTAYMMTIDGVNVCHLGPISKLPNADALEVLQNADILMVPVGGDDVLTPKKAKELIDKIEPRISIPMMYSIDSAPENRSSLDDFFKEMGESPDQQSTLKTDKNKLPVDQSIIANLKKS